MTPPSVIASGAAFTGELTKGSWVAGDTVLLYLQSNAGTPDTPSGWTRRHTSGSSQEAFFTRQLTAADDAVESWSFTATGGAVNTVQHVVVRGGNPAGAFDTSAYQTWSGSTTFGVSLTTASADSLLVVIASQGADITWSPPDGSWTEGFDGPGVFGFSASKSQPAAGATGTLTFTGSASSNGQAVLFALSPDPFAVTAVSPSSFADAQTGIAITCTGYDASGNAVILSPLDDINGETAVGVYVEDDAIGGTNPTTSTAITIPTPLPTGGLLLVAFTSRDHASGTAQPTVTDDNGGAAWTQKRSTTDRKSQFWYKRVEANLEGKTITISGAVGSLAPQLVVLGEVFPTGDPIEDITEETNTSGNETHAGITPSHAGAAVVFVVFNYANDNAVTSVSAANFGSPDFDGEHLSTGGSDCAVHMSVWENQPASASGAFTWAQTNGTTYSFACSVRPRTPAGAAITQTITAESPTAITFTVVQSTLALGAAYLFVKNSGGFANATGYAVTLTAPSKSLIPHGVNRPRFYSRRKVA